MLVNPAPSFPARLADWKQSDPGFTLLWHNAAPWSGGLIYGMDFGYVPELAF